MNNPLENYNPNDIAVDNGNFMGLPFTYETAKLIIISVPWEATVSYHQGTAQAPQQILDASLQIDLFDFDYPDGWQQGIFLKGYAQEMLESNEYYREQATKVIENLAIGIKVENSQDLRDSIFIVNHGSKLLNEYVFKHCETALNLGKKIAVIGGDHSVPLGCFQALSSKYNDFGILHIDAHADLRNAYEGFEFSHASIMFNAMKIPQITKLVQVGLRDICHEEVQMINESNNRIIAYYDAQIKQQLYAGKSWLEQCQEIVSNLPEKVYISFDVDGLDPKLCPHTGTPVPGGLELEQVYCLFREVVKSGREIIGFDVCEVGDDEWDANVGARITYKLANFLHLSTY
ncbi:agmatinase family protein [Anabaena sp. FACHB-1237]|uniref:agmatinase family protein n=1 Tax=Anabaena sp. FACHB-1237 TaxID=2692769 RepID=UPI001681A791|nr:agmatinase family protein [Anabaena sp. FACHB-1237]MBD2136930.1 agmatinase family protein [Anabaena sp. FACHB-1237]